MRQNADNKFPKCLRGVAIAIVASGAVAAPAVYAKPADSLVLVPPTDLPQLARQGGEAMFLHQTVDGRTLLYVEHKQGAGLDVLDVTDPGHIKGEASVQLGASGAFDFVSALGEQAELIRFRQGEENAVLDLHKERAPTLKTVQGLTLSGLSMPLGGDGFTVSTQVPADAQPTRDYQVVDTAKRVFDVKQVRQEIANQDTGTTFLLTDNGVYVIRRPAAEMAQQFRDNNNAN
ncbi:MAG TPA: hypothetical protein VHN17_01760 [Steroidobacteraceae bacterium]|jgi:hypothetical protein|nr:hypothetical protein [Steroidobacteraceae bacterium]